jgi:hypothetical protein
VQQRVYQMRAHKPGPAGHEYESHPLSSKAVAKTAPPRRQLPHGESTDTHADFRRSVEIGAIIGITAAEWLGLT